MSANRADITAVIGSSGSGKSLWIKTRALPELRRPVLVWDVMREYQGGTVYHSLAELARSLRPRLEVPPLLVYRPLVRRDKLETQFNMFCGIALAFAPLAVIAEELSMVTKAGYSPPRWLELIVTGRHKGVSVIGTTQAPALCDKTFFGNATLIRVGRLNSASAKKYMADALDVPPSELAGLKPLEWIVRDMATGAVTREVLTPPGPRARKRKTA